MSKQNQMLLTSFSPQLLKILITKLFPLKTHKHYLNVSIVHSFFLTPINHKN